MIALYDRLGRPSDAARYRRLAVAVLLHTGGEDQTIRADKLRTTKGEVEDYRRTKKRKRPSPV